MTENSTYQACGISESIRSAEALDALVGKLGFLPFFKNELPGFSVEEHTPQALWFPEDEACEGPWEWKGPVVRMKNCVYGKFFRRKAGFISREWFGDFLNYRRDGYDFDARYDDGLAAYKDKLLYDVLLEHGSLLTGELRDLANFRKGGNKGFETVITRLQMQGYVIIEDFVYKTDDAGNRSGWGIARYTTPEALFGADFVQTAYQRTPEESRARLLAHLASILPQAEGRQLLSVLG